MTAAPPIVSKRDPKYRVWHPLKHLFWNNGWGTDRGMNWLQERGYISDLCVTPEDVAECDVQAILEKAGAWYAMRPPRWPERNTHE